MIYVLFAEPVVLDFVMELLKGASSATLSFLIQEFLSMKSCFTRIAFLNGARKIPTAAGSARAAGALSF